MQKVALFVELAAESPSTVLLTGETGVGKEAVAREPPSPQRPRGGILPGDQLRRLSGRRCSRAGFWHVKGLHGGRPRQARSLRGGGRGTLFLDEIAEMALPLQAKLLRVLQEREVRPVGGARIVRVECRILAATNRVLAEEVGAACEDLFYRLNVFPIRIPPLRERRDVLPLTRHFLALHGPREGKPDCPLLGAAAQLLESYAWPGNVRASRTRSCAC
ncbi:MAG: sigma 54-interacting transcriptional regulator [Myxococcota bacterium]